MKNEVILNKKIVWEDFVWLIFAHGIGDMALQTETMHYLKPIYPMVMLSHCIVWAGCISVALKYIGKFAFWKFVLLVELHLITDFGSQFLLHYFDWPEQSVNLIDQVAHFIQICFVYFYDKEEKNVQNHNRGKQR